MKQKRWRLGRVRCSGDPNDNLKHLWGQKLWFATRSIKPGAIFRYPNDGDPSEYFYVCNLRGAEPFTYLAYVPQNVELLDIYADLVWAVDLAEYTKPDFVFDPHKNTQGEVHIPNPQNAPV